MANPSKQKGTAFETAVVRYCRENGFPLCERRALAGALDLGDALLCPGVILEMKAHATVTDGLIKEWLIETERERKNANATYGILVVKRPRRAVQDSWAVQRAYGGWPRFTWLADQLDELRSNGWGDS